MALILTLLASYAHLDDWLMLQVFALQDASMSKPCARWHLHHVAGESLAAWAQVDALPVEQRTLGLCCESTPFIMRAGRRLAGGTKRCGFPLQVDALSPGR